MNQTIMRRLASAALLAAAVPSHTTAAEVVGSNQPPVEAVGGQAASLSLLTNALQMKRLLRDEALRHYPVRIRGVITCVQPEYNGFVLQDSTRGVYVKYSTPEARNFPRVGEECEVAGVTDAGFSPMVRPSQVTRLGTGTMREPVHASWDQLMNGSLDTQ